MLESNTDKINTIPDLTGLAVQGKVRSVMTNNRGLIKKNRL